MGGRGARFGVSVKGKKYGTEYESVLQVGRIKFVKMIDDRPKGKKPLKPLSVKTPMETMTNGRIYVTVNEANKPISITFYQKGMRRAQIDLEHDHGNLGRPHTHKGYKHDEGGSRKINKFERNLIENIKNTWYNHK